MLWRGDNSNDDNNNDNNNDNSNGNDDGDDGDDDDDDDDNRDDLLFFFWQNYVTLGKKTTQKITLKIAKK